MLRARRALMQRQAKEEMRDVLCYLRVWFVRAATAESARARMPTCDAVRDALRVASPESAQLILAVRGARARTVCIALRRVSRYMLLQSASASVSASVSASMSVSVPVLDAAVCLYAVQMAYLVPHPSSSVGCGLRATGCSTLPTSASPRRRPELPEQTYVRTSVCRCPQFPLCTLPASQPASRSADRYV